MRSQIPISSGISEATIITIIIVMFILPQILLLGEKVIDKTSFDAVSYTHLDDDARDAVGQNALRGGLLQNGDQVADGKEVGLDRNDHNKEQKQDDVQRVLKQHILQLLRVHFLRIRHFLNLFIHIAQPDA